MIVFLHIPKAAGSSWINALRTGFGRDAVFTQPGQGWPHDVAASDATTGAARVAAGHLVRPARDTDGEYRYHTFVRDPVRRVESAHRYLLVTPRNHLHDLAVKSRTLLEFLEEAGVEFDNGQARRLSPGGFDRGAGALHDADVEALVTEITEERLLAGCSEQFDLSALKLGRALGLEWPVYWRTNTTKSAGSSPNLQWGIAADELRHHPRLRFDLAVYDAARTVLARYPTDDLAAFERRLARHRARQFPRMATRSLRVRLRRRRDLGSR